MRFGIWLPWPVWIAVFVLGGPLILIWALIATATFIVVTAIAWPCKRSFRDGAQIGATVYAWMLVPGHMARQHNARSLRGS